MCDEDKVYGEKYAGNSFKPAWNHAKKYIDKLVDKNKNIMSICFESPQEQIPGTNGFWETVPTGQTIIRITITPK